MGNEDGRVTPGITVQLLDGAQAAAHAEELQPLHAEVYAGPPYGQTGDAALFADRLRVQVARTRDPRPGSPVADVFLTNLPAKREP